ncbi:hypothetical protein TTRE_0000848901, partial [Trichuris trichiura]
YCLNIAAGAVFKATQVFAFDVKKYKLVRRRLVEELIIKLAQNMTQDRVLELILPKFVSYCRDTAICVRKVCVPLKRNRLVSRDVVERVLMLHLIALSQDPIWGVRKSCVECMPDFAAICCMRARWQHLTPVYLVLLSDSNQWVRYSAQQFLGPFIATFANPARTGLKCVGDCVVYDESAQRIVNVDNIHHLRNGFFQEIVPHALLDSYLAMPNADPTQSMENDVPRHCAHSFPAVALTLGRSNWHLLRTAYHALVVNSWVSCGNSIQLLGFSFAIIDLPTFSHYEHIRRCDDYRLFSSCKVLLQWCGSCFCRQLIKICNLFGIEDLNEYFSPIAMTLAIDRVAEVRFFTCKLVLILYFDSIFVSSNKPKTLLTDSFAQDIVKSFACSVKFLRRQTFARICGEILEQQAVGISDFGRLFLPAFNELLVDKVTNVRITAACILSEHCVTMRRMNPLETFNAMVSDLASDKDVNVRSFLENMFQNGSVSDYPRANHGI